jgi:hypothetical protein
MMGDDDLNFLGFLYFLYFLGFLGFPGFLHTCHHRELTADIAMGLARERWRAASVDHRLGCHAIG